MTKAVTLANLASGEALTVDETNNRIGIASTAPSASVDVKQTILLDGNSGVVTATSFVGDGSALTGIAATDNIDTNTIRVSGISTLANTKIGIGKSINFGSFQKASIQGHSVGLGTTTRDGRDAGIGTAGGELVMVTDDYTHGTQICVYCGDAKGWVGVTTEKISRSMDASGGNVEEDVGGYKRHIYTSPGNFVVSQTIPTSNTVSVLVVAGGGAGGG